MDYLSLCLICKDENDYLPEWLDYHILMGVERFYIYDNESQVSLRESLADYIERGWVVVVDIPGRAMQLYAYDHCLYTFGANTRWLGFIDTDEFLVPKTTLDLKELLKDYEAYGGLAVSSLFFGSNGHHIRPIAGQITAYTMRTHETSRENELVKSIVQPELVQMPNTPHEFLYKANTWCVNEGFLRVDYQRFPNQIEKIQLNHYFCRSNQELDQKLLRGRGAADEAWPRKRFELVNQHSNYCDFRIIENLNLILNNPSFESSRKEEYLDTSGLVEKMAMAAKPMRQVRLDEKVFNEKLFIRHEFLEIIALKAQIRSAVSLKDYEEVKRLTLLELQISPLNLWLYTELVTVLIFLNDSQGAWQVLSQAWQISPNRNFLILSTMSGYFLSIENFNMAEKTCRLILEIAPHNLLVLGQLAYSLLGQERFEDALKVGVPVIELSAFVGEMPEEMYIFLLKKMADYLSAKKDYAGAIALWKHGLKCKPDDVSVMVELIKVLILSDDKAETCQKLNQLKRLAPHNKDIPVLQMQVDILFKDKKGQQ